MSSNKCPVCGSQEFYIKDPDDEYETYEFELRDGQIMAGPVEEMPAVEADTETYCNKCAWHDRFKALHNG